MQVTKNVVSVSEMARMLGFSRARFYQLMNEGVLPKPTKPGTRGRPFFTREQQEQCIEVRRTNRGLNGHAILFYAMRPPSPSPRTTRQSRQRSTHERPQRNRDDDIISDLRHGLAQLGVNQATEQSILTALAVMYPDGWSNVDQGELLRAVFNRLNCQDSQDNVA